MKKIILALLTILIHFHCFSQNRPVVGAIRWDAWQGANDHVGREVNRSLSPLKWHSRLPFFSTVISDDSVNIDGSTQTVMDQEIIYASKGKLDYFAFLLYNDSISLSTPLHNYLRSTNKPLLRFCVIAQENESISRVIRYIQDNSYLTVLDGRPLVYTFRQRNNPAFALKLKDSCRIAGIKEPYIVDLHWDEHMPDSPVWDGVSDYWYDGSRGSVTGADYSELRTFAIWYWNQRLLNNAKQVPLVSLGNDGRPRIENHVNWVEDPVSLYEKYYNNPDPEEFIAHLKDAFDFISSNPGNCEAKAVLIYAWNENDEGGWLVPTLNPDGSINTERLDALGKFLDKYDESLNF